MSVHLVTGGARSGKSRFALQEAEALPGRIEFVATAEAGDPDMAARIAHHRAERGPRYQTTEAPLALVAALAALPPGGPVIVDCLTLWCANLIFADRTDVELRDEFRALAGALVTLGRPVFVVTNEVGLGIVPGDALSRRYRDELGRLNQAVAAVADRVTLMISGLPLAVR